MTSQASSGGGSGAGPSPQSGQGGGGLLSSLRALGTQVGEGVAELQKQVAAVGDASNTTNRGELIVTATFPFVADTVVPSDVLFTEEGGEATKPHRNWITCDKAPPDQTTTEKTLCRGERIVHEQTNIGDPHGPPSINDDFDGEGGGVANGRVYKKNAHPVVGACSPDTDVEGKPVVRHHDPSKQNKDNTDGLFLHSGLDFGNPPLDKLKARRCAVENLSAVCKEGREAENGRLEVLEGNEVTVTFDWVNLATSDPEARKKPQCQLPKHAEIAHARVSVFRKEHDLFTNAYDALEKHYTESKEKVLDAEWLGEPPEHEAPEVNEKKEYKSFAEEQAELAEKGGTYQQTEEQRRRVERASPSHSNVQAVQHAERPPQTAEQHAAATQAARDAHARDEAAAARQADLEAAFAREGVAKQADEVALAFSAIAGGVSVIQSYVEFARAFAVKPMEVRVEVQGCAGAQVVTVAAFPRKKFAIDFVKLHEVKKAADALRNILSTIERFFGAIKAFKLETSVFEIVPLPRKKDVDSQLVILNQPYLILAFEYRELSRDSDAQNGESAGRKKNQVHKAWRIEIGITTVLGWYAVVKFPVVRFAPCIGELGNLLLRLAQVEINVEVEVDIGIGAEGVFELDEYGKLKSLPAQLTPRAIFSIGLVFRAGELAKASIKIVGGIELPMEAFADSRGMFVKRLESTLSLDLVWEASINLFGWEIGTGETIPIMDPVKVPEGELRELVSFS